MYDSEYVLTVSKTRMEAAVLLVSSLAITLVPYHGSLASDRCWGRPGLEVVRIFC